jgi:hypothetical protein
MLSIAYNSERKRTARASVPSDRGTAAAGKLGEALCLMGAATIN